MRSWIFAWTKGFRFLHACTACAHQNARSGLQASTLSAQRVLRTLEFRIALNFVFASPARLPFSFIVLIGQIVVRSPLISCAFSHAQPLSEKTTKMRVETSSHFQRSIGNLHWQVPPPLSLLFLFKETLCLLFFPNFHSSQLIRSSSPSEGRKGFEKMVLSTSTFALLSTLLPLAVSAYSLPQSEPVSLKSRASIACSATADCSKLAYKIPQNSHYYCSKRVCSWGTSASLALDFKTS